MHTHKTSPYSGTKKKKKSNSVKMTMPHKVSYKLKAIRIPVTVFTEIEKLP